jgi:hypothetical protein
MERAPSAAGQHLSALELHFSPPREIAVIGPSGDPATAALRAAVLEQYAPTTVYAFAESGDDPATDRVPLLAGKDLVAGRPAAYVCESFACKAPVTDPDELRAALAV